MTSINVQKASGIFMNKMHVRLNINENNLDCNQRITKLKLEKFGLYQGQAGANPDGHPKTSGQNYSIYPKNPKNRTTDWRKFLH